MMEYARANHEHNRDVDPAGSPDPRARSPPGAQRRRRSPPATRASGAGRVRITSYMENIGWPELLGYMMDRVHNDPDFAAEQRPAGDHLSGQTMLTMISCRPPPSRRIVGMYWDITLFGMRIHHNADRCPEFEPHPFGNALDLTLLGRFDFRTTGDMPRVLREVRAAEGGGCRSVRRGSWP